MNPYVFKDAARAIEKGWVQHVNRKRDKGDKHDRVCLLTAIADSLDRDDNYHEHMELLWRELGQHPQTWNDHPARTKKEVIKFLKDLSYRKDLTSV